MQSTAVEPAILSEHHPAAVGTNIGFKDWAVICEALGQGRQSVILRKGGIAEGRDGFRFKHERFFLFPTQYHQQFDKIRGDVPRPALAPAPPEGTVVIRYLFVLEWAHWIADWPTLARLESFHLWREDVVRERFDYDDHPGLQCAFGRVYRCATPWSFPSRPAYGGCRSWVALPEPPAEVELTAVLGDEAHRARRRELEGVLSLP